MPDARRLGLTGSGQVDGEVVPAIAPDPAAAGPAAGTGHRWRIAAWAVLTSTSGLTTASVVAWCAAAPPWHPWMLYTLVDLVVGAVYGVVAWLTLLRRTHLAAWIMAAAGVGGSLSAAAACWGMVAYRWPDLWMTGQLAGVAYWAWVPGFYALVVVLPWLLPVRPLDRSTRVAVGVGAVLIVVAQACALTLPGGLHAIPLTDATLLAARAAVDPWLEPALVVLGVAAAVGVLARRRTLPRQQRHGLGWLAIGTLLLAAAFLPLALNPAFQVAVPVPFAPLLMLGAQAFFPASVLVVVLRQRLWGLELTIRRTLVWALMTGLVISAYVVGVLLLGAVTPATSAVPEAVVTALLAAGFQPARAWVQRRVDRLVHGDDGQRLIRQVADRLRAAERSTRMLDAVADGIADSLRLAAVAVTLTGAPPVPPRRPPAWDGPAAGGPALVVCLASGNRPVGELWAWPRPGERLDGRTAALLHDLAPVVTALAELALAQRDLDRSRVRLAQSRDEERRKLRRDLHDDLGPAISGVALALTAGRNMLRPHRCLPEITAADDLLGQLVAEMDRQATGIREIARDLVPPLLEGGGLRPALYRLRERYADAGLTVLVRASEVALPETVATAVYGIVGEAVRNVRRHAGVDRCAIDVSVGSGRLVVCVTDEGVGIPAPLVAGVGTASMRERAEGIGAALTIARANPEHARPGTTVQLVLPVPAPVAH
ncbi:Sensor histidine kinase LiaS [Micromonospora sp. MW-13]|uniref:sensor histidine kinase n=1 Tax=Micromonospora sp. MW-13 TaxID=2094022 RepID=UPI000E445255|nr:ATP-binding protein [Micromonospora sp. MW-13]RGC69378.1 Sensor histidine kinase LiaS [Micromonospora sp. MW-13]